MRAAFIIVLWVAAFSGGYYYAEANHGDYILARDGAMCAAFNPDQPPRIVGRWSPASDGKCHMRDFLLSNPL